MFYSKLYLKKEFKIPTILSLFLVLIAVYITGRFLLTSSIPTRAQKGNVEKVELVNLYPNQITFAWISEEAEEGWVLYGTSPESLTNTASDIRDSGGKRGKFKNHFIILKALNNSTKYYALIVSGEKLVYENNDKPFEFTTPKTVVNKSNQKPAYGKVFSSQKKPLEGALVLLSINDFKKMGALSTQNGEWLIPLNYILDNKLMQVTPSQEDIVKFEMYGNDSLKSTVNAHISDISPLNQNIILGKNYDILNREDVLGSSTGGAITLDTVDFLYPKENSIIPASSPLIKGVALPSATVSLTLQGEKTNKSYSLKANPDGQWNLNTISFLTPGKYTLTVSSNDKTGNKIEKKRSFTIAKSGEQVLGESTPSAITSTPEPTAAPTLEPTQIPTQPVASPSPTIPVSGNSAIYMWIASIALVAVGFGLILFSSI